MSAPVVHPLAVFATSALAEGDSANPSFRPEVLTELGGRLRALKPEEARDAFRALAALAKVLDSEHRGQPAVEQLLGVLEASVEPFLQWEQGQLRSKAQDRLESVHDRFSRFLGEPAAVQAEEPARLVEQLRVPRTFRP